MLSVTNNSTNKIYRYNLVIDNLKELSKFLNENPETKNLNTFIDKANCELPIGFRQWDCGSLNSIKILNTLIISNPITKLLILFVTNLYHVLNYILLWVKDI